MPVDFFSIFNFFSELSGSSSFRFFSVGFDGGPRGFFFTPAINTMVENTSYIIQL